MYGFTHHDQRQEECTRNWFQAIEPLHTGLRSEYLKSFLPSTRSPTRCCVWSRRCGSSRRRRSDSDGDDNGRRIVAVISTIISAVVIPIILVIVVAIVIVIVVVIVFFVVVLVVVLVILLIFGVDVAVWFCGCFRCIRVSGLLLQPCTGRERVMLPGSTSVPVSIGVAKAKAANAATKRGSWRSCIWGFLKGVLLGLCLYEDNLVGVGDVVKGCQLVKTGLESRGF